MLKLMPGSDTFQNSVSPAEVEHGPRGTTRCAARVPKNWPETRIVFRERDYLFLSEILPAPYLPIYQLIAVLMKRKSTRRKT